MGRGGGTIQFRQRITELDSLVRMVNKEVNRVAVAVQQPGRDFQGVYRPVNLHEIERHTRPPIPKPTPNVRLVQRTQNRRNWLAAA